MDDDSNLTSLKERDTIGMDVSGAIHKTCTVLLNALNIDGPIREELGRKFEPALADLIEVEIVPLESEYGAFRVANGCLSLNEQEISRLIAYVLEDMKSQLERQGSSLSAQDITQTIEETASLFALHELRHRTQGVQEFATVQLLKSIDGRDRIATFDVQADRDAAVALAASKADSLESDEFFENYQRALFYSVQYFFRIYPANTERPDKVCRIAALLFMLARLEIYLSLGHLRVAKAITGLSVSIADDHKSLAIYQNEPEHRLLTAANDVAELPRFIANIENGDLDTALGQAFSIVLAIGCN